MFEGECIVIYTVCKLLGFLNLWIHIFHQFCELSMIYSDSFFPTFSLSFLSAILLRLMWNTSLSSMSQCFCTFHLFIFLSWWALGDFLRSAFQINNSFFFSCDLSVVNMSLFFSLSFKIYIYIFYSFKIWNNFHFKIIIESSVAKIVQRVHEYLCSAFPNGDLLNN